MSSAEPSPLDVLRQALGVDAGAAPTAEERDDVRRMVADVLATGLRLPAADEYEQAVARWSVDVGLVPSAHAGVRADAAVDLPGDSAGEEVVLALPVLGFDARVTWERRIGGAGASLRVAAAPVEVVDETGMPRPVRVLRRVEVAVTTSADEQPFVWAELLPAADGSHVALVSDAPVGSFRLHFRPVLPHPGRESAPSRADG